MEAEPALASKGEHIEPVVEDSADETQPVEAALEKLDGNPGGNPSTDLEPISAAEGQSAHNIEASS